MKATLALAALAGLVSSVSGQYYGIIAARSASPIHLAPVAANGQRLWIGKKTTSYCPDVVGDSCPRGRKTTFAGGDGTLGSKHFNYNVQFWHMLMEVSGHRCARRPASLH